MEEKNKHSSLLQQRSGDAALQHSGRRTTSLPRSKTRGAGFAGEEEKKGNLNVG
jgi:hypothetical protein